MHICTNVIYELEDDPECTAHITTYIKWVQKEQRSESDGREGKERERVPVSWAKVKMDNGERWKGMAPNTLGTVILILRKHVKTESAVQ